MMTQRDGSPADGAVPGQHRVRIRKTEWIYSDGIDPQKFAQQNPHLVPPEPEPHWLIPTRYGEYETLGLTAEVTPSVTTDLLFDLVD